MVSKDVTISEDFYQTLKKRMENGDEMSIRQIYSLFPEVKPKTLSWRLHKLVQAGKLQRVGHGYYALDKIDRSNTAGFDYMQKASQAVFDIVIDYGYEFYITGLDSLVGEMLHVPENYPVLLVVEDSGVSEIQDALSDKGFLVITERERNLIGVAAIKKKTDVFILKGKNFSFSVDHIAQKEKGFVDLYFAVTRMEYGVSVPELFRIYQNLLRNKSLAALNVKNAAKDRGLSTEINWVMGLSKTPEKAREFMGYQIREIL